MPNPFQRMVERLQPSMDSLDSTMATEERRLDDLNPRNLREIDWEMRQRDRQQPSQQATLSQERRRLEQVQGAQMQQAAQAFQQRLQQRLNPRIGTPQDTDPRAAQAAFMARLMAQMQRRYPGMQGGPTP